MIYRKSYRFFDLFLILISALIFLPAQAEEETVYYRPITDIFLNVKELSLHVGDQVKLPLTWLPAETPNVFLKWYTDDKTISIDPGSLTVTALSAGKTRLLVESNSGFAWDYCDITVTGSEAKNAAEKKAGTELVTLSDSARKKIEAETLLHYLDFLESSSFIQEDFAALSGRHYNLTAVVRPGTVSAQSRLAISLGMEKALELPDFSAVSLYGTLGQILEYAENNDDLVRLFEFEPMTMDDPITEQDYGTAPKSMNLKDNVEELTSVSTAHRLGLKGDNVVIAIIDSGLNKNHEQFRGRVIAEYCAGHSDDEMYASCNEGSSEPTNSQIKAEYNHGSHVTGIAAGRDGIAPNTKIISINHSVETCFENECYRQINFSIWEVSQYLADLQKKYKAAGKPQIAAVNLSFGPTKSFSDNCDDKYKDYKEAFDLLLENDIIPVTASGNAGFLGNVQPYGCISGSLTVGALADFPDPTIRGTSSHGLRIDILAPGTHIWSALLTDDGKEDTVCSGINCYGSKNGTSMAAPMVTGALAILKQADPSLTASELKSLIISMSTKTANYRLKNNLYPATTFEFDKPVLDFSEIEKYISPAPRPDHEHDFWHADMEVLPRTGFSPAHPHSPDAMPKDLKYRSLDMILEIPTLGVLSEIVEVPVINNEYAVTWLGDSVGMLEGSAQPGEGTVILAAHNHLNDSESGPFALLSSMEEGERIFIRDGNNDLLTFIVYANAKVSETDFEAVDQIAGSFEDTLIMITCEDEMISGGYANRRIVAAKKVR